MSYEVQVGWGKSVSLPPKPFYVAPDNEVEVKKFVPDPPSGIIVYCINIFYCIQVFHLMLNLLRNQGQHSPGDCSIAMFHHQIQL